MKLKTINKEIEHLGFMLVRGKGYFYFVPIRHNTPILKCDGVYTNTLGKDVGFWVRELQNKIKEA